ncbi:MAG TPA: phage GP46 family protein [Methylophilaceae bacterium]|nr:phage GP46 family protein [Methylophilaceae bacterium]
MTIFVNGVESSSLDQADSLIRAVIISLFTWRRANPDDVTEGAKMGYWGDAAEPPAENDKIGSRLWLLAREKILPSTFNRAREYATEALLWMIADGVATKVTVDAERFNVDGLALIVTIYRVDGSDVVLRFNKAWEIIRAV